MILKKVIIKRNHIIRGIVVISNGNFNSRRIENIPLTQQTDITNNITENSTQTINYVGKNI